MSTKISSRRPPSVLEVSSTDFITPVGPLDAPGKRVLFPLCIYIERIRACNLVSGTNGTILLPQDGYNLSSQSAQRESNAASGKKGESASMKVRTFDDHNLRCLQHGGLECSVLLHETYFPFVCTVTKEERRAPEVLNCKVLLCRVLSVKDAGSCTSRAQQAV